MTKVVNFYGGPSAGKSTMAAQLFGYMKAERLNVEYVPEFAKTLTWQKSGCLDDQIYVFAQQHHAIYTLKDQVDYIITDSPLILGLHYINMAQEKFAMIETFSQAFKNLVLSTYNQYDNYNYYVERGDRQFIQAGRNQNEMQARAIDDSVFRILVHNGIMFKRVNNLNDIVADLLGSK